jgi:hypothetical protein
MVDLSLASSYIPMFVCILKTIFISVLCSYTVSIGGICGLTLIVLIDRIFFNSDFIVDVNAITSVVLWAQISNYERHHKSLLDKSMQYFSIVVNIIWTIMGLIQIWKTNFSKSKSEILIYSACALSLTFTYFPYESLVNSLMRIVAFNTALFVQIYWQISSSQEESLASNVMRNGVILMSCTPIAVCILILYVSLTVFKWKPMYPVVIVSNDSDTEAAVLREVLALRKEKNSN